MPDMMVRTIYLGEGGSSSSAGREGTDENENESVYG